MARRLIAIVVLVLLSGVPARADDYQLPNLVPFAPDDISIGRPDGGPGRALRFATSTANLGTFHFELFGDVPESGTKSDALQCVRWSFRTCLERRSVGSFDFHSSHAHWHLDGYAKYELRDLADDGTPDMTPEGLVVDGGKISFCLVDVARTESAEPFPDDPFAFTGYYNACVGVLQGISKGWADVYDSDLTGQQLLIEEVPDGAYAIVITIDPDGRLLETTRADNSSWQAIRLWGDGTVVTMI